MKSLWRQMPKVYDISGRHQWQMATTTTNHRHRQKQPSAATSPLLPVAANIHHHQQPLTTTTHHDENEWQATSQVKWEQAQRHGMLTDVLCCLIVTMPTTHKRPSQPTTTTTSHSHPQSRAFSAKNSTCMRNLFVKIDHLDEASLQACGCDIYISHVVACNIHEFLSDMV